MRILRRLSGSKSDNVHFSYEEKRYPIGVSILLFMMTVVVWMLGQRALQDVSAGIPRIEYPRYYELPANEAAEDYWETNVQPLHRLRSDLEQQIERSRGEYDSSLLENVAGEAERLYGDEESIRAQFSSLQNRLRGLNEQIREAEVTHRQLQSRAGEERESALQEYRRKNRWRQAKVFAWEAVFWVPFFFLTLSWHARGKRKQSKWEVISLSSFVAASLLSLQSIGVLLWSWIPRRFLEWLWEILSATLFTRIIGYYLMVGLVVLLFGWFIVIVHKRMMDPVRGGRKKIRQGCCPVCSYPLNLSDAHCGGCGRMLKQQCPSCKEDRYTWEAVCTHCGTE